LGKFLAGNQSFRVKKRVLTNNVPTLLWLILFVRRGEKGGTTFPFVLLPVRGHKLPSSLSPLVGPAIVRGW
jgi:hypothetical protein